MLIIIYGEDTYRSREWLQALKINFQKKFDANGYNINRFQRNLDFAELQSAICAPPFLSGKRLVICENFFESVGEKKETEEILSSIPESTIVIVWEEGGEKNFSKIPLFAKFIRKKTTKTYVFPLMRAAEIERWIKERSNELGLQLERGALQNLIARVGTDLWQLNTELEKFAALNKPITSSLIAESVRGRTPENIFAFTDALSARNIKSALQQLANERASGAAIAYLITMLARQFRLLRAANDYLTNHPQVTATGLAEVFGWHPFVAKKTAAQARKFTSVELAGARDAIFETDYAIKTGIHDPDAALDLLIAKLLVPERIS